MEKLSLDPNKELWQWGPTPVRMFFPADFLEGIFDDKYFRAEYPASMCWPKGYALVYKKQFTFINSLDELQKSGTELFLTHLLPLKARELVVKKYLKDLAELKAKEKEIEKLDVSTLTDSEFEELWHDFHELTIGFWRHVTVPELANYGAIYLLENEVEKQVKNKEKAAHILEILTSPENPSFFQIEEMELAQTKDIAKHTKKYFWLKNSYAKTEVLNQEFFENRRKTLDKDVETKYKLYQKETQKRKEAIIEEYKLPKNIVDIAKAIVYGIEWQDERKKEIGIGFTCAEGKVVKLSLEETIAHWNTYVERKDATAQKELKGVVVSKGKKGAVSGKVKIILDPLDADSFENGDILVTSMTSPDFIFLMKKASAVITDVGGLTSHAAIVSRELNIPCIVGTKIATKVLKDGDRVELDIKKSVVRKVN